jgi:hypothetical protein
MESPAIRYLWVETKKILPSVKLGGIFVDKPGYHNSREGNESNDYSVRLLADKQGPPNLGSAIDLTMSDAEMRKRTGYLRTAALDPEDNRTSYLREFIGTLNSTDVYCLIASGPGTAFKYDGSRAKSHLWHIHASFYRLYCNDYTAMDAFLSVFSGESFAQWIERITPKPPTVQKGDDMVLVQVRGNARVYIGNTVEYRWLKSPAALKALQDNGFRVLVVTNKDDAVAILGNPVTSSDAVQ